MSNFISDAKAQDINIEMEMSQTKTIPASRKLGFIPDD